MTFGEVREGVQKLLRLPATGQNAYGGSIFWRAGYPHQGYIRVHITEGDARTVQQLPDIFSAPLSGRIHLWVTCEQDGPSSTREGADTNKTGGRPTRPVPVPLPRPPPPAQHPVGAVIIDTLKPPDVPEGYNIHIHVPTQKWYFAKDQTTQWLHPLTGHTYQIGQQSSRSKQGVACPDAGWSVDGNIPHQYTQQEVTCPLHVRQRVLLQPPQVSQPWTVQPTLVRQAGETPYTLWYFTRTECWSWVHPGEYTTARQASNEEEFKHFGEGNAVQLNLKGQPVPPKQGRGKRRVTFDPASPAGSVKSNPTVPSKAPSPFLFLMSLLKGLGGSKRQE